jgi:homoserine O-acetyltransferase/O-succinyltransferase
MPDVLERDFVLKDFRFASGQVLPELRQHYLTLGTPRKNAAGEVENAVLLVHNTGGDARIWLEPGLAGQLFGEGMPLDAGRYFLVIPDCIGFGRSSKPSDGLRARFPNYRLHDIVAAQHRLVTEGLGVRKLKLVMGLSLGGMITWLFAGTHPEFMERLVPVASQPGPMSGRNWIQRRINVEAIRNDPDWKGGDYETQPANWVRAAPLSALFTQSVVRLQEQAPTRERADALYRQLVERAKQGDANDRLFQIEATMDYDPTPLLGRIRAPLLAINFADDAINPPELGVMEAAIARIPGARHVLVAAGAASRGHFSTLDAALWKEHLAAFLA